MSNREKSPVIYKRRLFGGVRFLLFFAIPTALLMIFLRQEDAKQHPSVVIDGRYVFRFERVEIGNDFIFFQPTVLDSATDAVKKIYDETKIKLEFSQPTSRSYFGGSGGRRLNHFEKDAVCFWISCYDKKSDKWVEEFNHLADGSCVSPEFTDANNESVGNRGSRWPISEKKNGKTIFGFAHASFNPTSPYFYVQLNVRHSPAALWRIKSPDAGKPYRQPYWVKNTTPLPAQKPAGDLAVTLASFRKEGFSGRFMPEFLLTKDGKDVSADYGVATWQTDSFGNNDALYADSLKTHAPARQIECRIYERGTAPFTANRRSNLGALKRPADGTLTPLNVKWNVGAEQLEVLALLGPGSFDFAGNRFVSSTKSLENENADGQSLLSSYGIDTDDSALDENGKKVRVRRRRTTVPALAIIVRSYVSPVIIGTKYDEKTEFGKRFGIPDGGLFQVLSPTEAPGSRSSEMLLIPLDWPESEIEKILEIGVPTVRDVSFFVTQAEIQKNFKDQ